MTIPMQVGHGEVSADQPAHILCVDPATKEVIGAVTIGVNVDQL